MGMSRVSSEFKKLISSIQIEFIKEGKKPPSAKKITKIIANQVKKEDILYNEIIRFR